MTALLQALHSQQEALKRLLREAGVPVDEAESLLLEAMCEISEEEWARMPQHQADQELLQRVAAACARFGAAQGPLSPAAPKQRRAGPRRRRRRA